jgi:hypothetical protein
MANHAKDFASFYLQIDIVQCGNIPLAPPVALVNVPELDVRFDLEKILRGEWLSSDD